MRDILLYQWLLLIYFFLFLLLFQTIQSLVGVFGFYGLLSLVRFSLDFGYAVVTVRSAPQ